MRSPFLGRERDRDRVGKPVSSSHEGGPRKARSHPDVPLGRAEQLEEELFTLEDQPSAGPVEGLQPVHPKEFRRLLAQQKQSSEAPSAYTLTNDPTSSSDYGQMLPEGFQGLNTVLHGIDEKLAEHNRNSGELSESVRDLPEVVRELLQASRTGAELLGGISQAIENQNQLRRDLVDQVKELADKFREIPEAVGKITERLECSEQDRERLDHSLQDVRRSVTDMQGESARRHESMLQQFRVELANERSAVQEQRDSDQQVLREVVERTGKHSQRMNLLMVLLILSAGTAITLLALR